ncbi:MAG: dephospho-CoA kinase [Cytophagales bacterium]
MSFLVGITGDIGSGKTTVSNILSHLGYKVYNSDERGKASHGDRHQYSRKNQ